MAKAAQWLKDLRFVVRRSNGPGWVLEDQYGRFKIQKIEVDAALSQTTVHIHTIALRAQQLRCGHRPGEKAAGDHGGPEHRPQGRISTDLRQP